MSRWHLPTGSHVSRARHCPGSFALSAVRETSPEAARGIAGHRYLEAAGRGTSHAAVMAQIPAEHHEMCAAIDLEGLPLGPGYLQEVAYALDLETGEARSLGSGLERDYSSARASEVVGTIDVACRLAAEVYDYKFEGFDSSTDPVERNDQLRFAALCEARVLGHQAAKATIIHFRPDGSHWEEPHEFDALDLDTFEGELHAIVARVRAAQEAAERGVVPDVSRGEWCHWCPAVPACPAITGLIRAAAQAPTATAEDILSALSPATAASAYRRVREVQDVMKKVQTALYLYASKHDIDLGDGHVYGAVRSERKVIDARIARKVLAERFGPEVAEAACEFETTQAAIGRALLTVVAAAKKEGQKVTVKSVHEAALAAIGAAGGIETKATTTVREHRVREALPPAQVDLEDESVAAAMEAP